MITSVFKSFNVMGTLLLCCVLLTAFVSSATAATVPGDLSTAGSTDISTSDHVEGIFGGRGLLALPLCPNCSGCWCRGGGGRGKLRCC